MADTVLTIIQLALASGALGVAVKIAWVLSHIETLLSGTVKNVEDHEERIRFLERKEAA